MNNRTVICFALCTVFFVFLILPYVADAGNTRKNDLNSLRTKKDELVCLQIQEKIKKNKESRKVVTTSIQLGYEACGVIKCAIRGGGDLKQVITGAIDAGSTKDVVSRCALDSGAEAKEVAGILSGIADSGVCYFLPEEPEIIVPPHAGTREGFLLSPSGF